MSHNNLPLFFRAMFNFMITMPQSDSICYSTLYTRFHATSVFTLQKALVIAV